MANIGYIQPMTQRHQDTIALESDSVTQLLIRVSEATDHGVYIASEGPGRWLVRLGRETFRGATQKEALAQCASHLEILRRGGCTSRG